MYKAKYFTPRELRCKCNSCIGMIKELLLVKLDQLRMSMDRPLIINSGFRCPAHNKAVGGEEHSYHMQGLAVDISTAGWAPGEREKLIAYAKDYDFTGIGIGSNFIHLDIRPGTPKKWTY
jgi:uncharacterized protein YcbK (DUF882 family)